MTHAPSSSTGSADDFVIFTYGDSQGEVLDYVFHECPQYRRYEDDPRVGWRSGWSTRGLGQAEHVERLTEPLKELTSACKHAFVFLAYGSVDIEWNLSYKRDALGENPDTAAFVEQMVNTLAESVDRIIATGEEVRASSSGGPDVHVVLCFPFVPLPLADGYLERYNEKHGGGSYRVIDRQERLDLWFAFCDEAQRRIVGKHPSVRVVDVREDFERDGLEAYIHLDDEDHHPNLAKSQHAVARHVRRLSFGSEEGEDGRPETVRLEPREWPKAEMYPRVRRRFPPKQSRAGSEPVAAGLPATGAPTEDAKPSQTAPAPPAHSSVAPAAMRSSSSPRPRPPAKDVAGGCASPGTLRQPLGTLRPALTQSPVMMRATVA